MIDSPEDYTELDAEKYKSDKYKLDKSSEDPELIKRRAKLLDADREMTQRKVRAREELEARRELRREKGIGDSPHGHKRKSNHKSNRRNRSPGEHSVIQLSESDDDNRRYNFVIGNTAQLSFLFSINSFFINSSGSGSGKEDDENDTASDSATNTKSNCSQSDEHSDYEIPTSPLSVGDLSKSEHRRRRSRGRSKSRSKSHSTSRSRSQSRSRSRSTRSHSRSTSRESRSE